MFEQSKIFYNVARHAGHGFVASLLMVLVSGAITPLILVFVKDKKDFGKFDDL